jgi:hypothetical protein
MVTQWIDVWSVQDRNYLRPIDFVTPVMKDAI